MPWLYYSIILLDSKKGVIWVGLKYGSVGTLIIIFAFFFLGWEIFQGRVITKYREGTIVEKWHGMAWHCNLRRAIIDGDSWILL